MNLEERLLKLERENKKLRKYIFVLALFVLLPLFASPIWFANAANSPKNLNVDKITAKSLLIVNNEGKIGAELSASILGGGLYIYNKEGKGAVWLCADFKGDGYLNIYNHQGESVAGLRASALGDGILDISNNQGKTVFTAP